jgi:hypothetical protein
MLEPRTDRDLTLTPEDAPATQADLEVQLVELITHIQVTTFSKSATELDKIEEIFDIASNLRCKQFELQAEVTALRKKFDAYIGSVRTP